MFEFGRMEDLLLAASKTREAEMSHLSDGRGGWLRRVARVHAGMCIIVVQHHWKGEIPPGV